MAQINNNGAPDKNTVGSIGDIYVDNITGNKYKLESIINISSHEKQSCYYVWKLVPEDVANSGSGSGSSGVSTLIDTATGDSYELEVTNGKLKLVLKEA